MWKEDKMTLKEKATNYAEESVDDISKEKTKEALNKGLQAAYLAGFQFAIEKCKEDGSKSGFDMAWFMEDFADEKL